MTRKKWPTWPRFEAVLKKDDAQEMSYVASDGLGNCDDVWTDPSYQGCGWPNM